jgi:hypothetical protein
MSPALADDITINLDQQITSVDIPVTVLEPVDATITTTNGLSNSGTWIDSWIELWQENNRVAFNDDGYHSATNVLASIINVPLTAGEYFIRATSWNFVAFGGRPVGSYLLTTNLVSTTPTPTPTPSEILEPTPLPTQEPVADNSDDEATSVQVIQETLPMPEPTPTLELVPEIVEQIVEQETLETPVIEPELSVEELEEQIQEQINELYIAENTIELQIPTALAEIPGVEQIFAATEAILNVGSDMTQEQREESQSVVVGAIIITQIASMASISVSQSSSRKFNKK